MTALRWNRVLSQKLFMDASANYTQYRHNLGMSMIESYKDFQDNTALNNEFSMAYRSGIHDLTGKVDFDYMPLPLRKLLGSWLSCMRRDMS